MIVVTVVVLMLFVAACSGGVSPRPALDTVPIREGGIDTTSADAGTSAASSSEPDAPEPTPKKSPSKPPAKPAPKKAPAKKGR